MPSRSALIAVLARLVPVAAGALLGASMSHPASWPLAAVALVAWCAADQQLARSAPALHARWLGPTALGLLALHVGGEHWIIGAPEAPQAPGVAWGLGALALAASSQAACLATCRWALLRALDGRGPARFPELASFLAWSAFWPCGESLRQLGWWGDGYAAPALAFVDAPGALRLLPVVGLSGLTALVVALAWLASRALSAAAPRRAGRGRPARALAGGLLGAVLLGSIGPLLPHPVETGAPLTVTALQTALDKRAPWTPAARDARESRLRDALRALPPGGVAITPETYFPEPRPRDGTGFWDELQATADRSQASALVGMPAFVLDTPGRIGLVNALVEIAPGRASLYAKERLVPGAEFVPMLPWLAPLRRAVFGGHPRSQLEGPSELTRGLYAGGVIAGASICHELAFELTMADRARGAQWLVNVSEDGWLGSEAYRRQMLAIARVRAAEAGLPLVRVSNLGATVLVDAQGRVARAAPAGLDADVTWQVAVRAGETFHTRHARALFFLPVIVSGLIVAVGMGRGIARRREGTRRVNSYQFVNLRNRRK